MDAQDPNLICGGHEYNDGYKPTQFPSFPLNNRPWRGLLRTYIGAALHETPVRYGGPMEVHATQDIPSVQLTVLPPLSAQQIAVLQLGAIPAAGSLSSVIANMGQ